MKLYTFKLKTITLCLIIILTITSLIPITSMTDTKRQTVKEDSTGVLVCVP